MIMMMMMMMRRRRRRRRRKHARMSGISHSKMREDQENAPVAEGTRDAQVPLFRVENEWGKGAFG